MELSKDVGVVKVGRDVGAHLVAAKSSFAVCDTMQDVWSLGATWADIAKSAEVVERTRDLSRALVSHEALLAQREKKGIVIGCLAQFVAPAKEVKDGVAKEYISVYKSSNAEKLKDVLAFYGVHESSRPWHGTLEPSTTFDELCATVEAKSFLEKFDYDHARQKLDALGKAIATHDEHLTTWKLGSEKWDEAVNAQKLGVMVLVEHKILEKAKDKSTTKAELRRIVIQGKSALQDVNAPSGELFAPICSQMKAAAQVE